MIRLYCTMIALLFYAVAEMPVFAQYKNPGWSFGAGGGMFSGQGDDIKNEPQFGGRAFLRFGFAPKFQGEVGAGYGEIGGSVFGYKTTLIPVDFRILLSPFELKSVNPYLFVGGGLISYKGTQGPVKDGSVAFIPAGAGLQFRMSNNLSLEVSGAFNYSFIDTLDGIILGPQKDGLWTALLGLTYTFESGSADSDQDGLPNDFEKQIATDPNIPDTDSDGLRDGDEYRKFKTDPRKADTDDDGLSDFDELYRHRTDPLKADTDGDGLTDGDEVVRHKTEPQKQDTDGDGLSDADEITVHKTDPLKLDTDGGGINDGAEITRKSNPLETKDDFPKKEEVKIGKRIVLEGVNFRSGSSDLSPESVARLQDVFTTLQENQEIEVEISGHTDNTGKRAKNVELSLGRAEAVKAYLVARGIPDYRIRTKGYGPDRPIAPNTTAEGRGRNRRIEFSRIK